MPRRAPLFIKTCSNTDGLIAHLYGLTEEEFAYILTIFPLVADPVKIAAQTESSLIIDSRVLLYQGKEVTQFILRRALHTD